MASLSWSGFSHRSLARRGHPGARADGRNGFTLTELMTGLAILAILSSLGAAGFSGVLARTRVSGEASDLLHAIELTRAEAAKRGLRVTLLPVSGDWTRGWQVFVDANGNRIADPGELVLLKHAALDASSRIVTNTTPGYIAFGSSGMPQQYSGAFLAATLTLCNAGNARGVVLARSGRPRSTTGNC